MKKFNFILSVIVIISLLSVSSIVYAGSSTIDYDTALDNIEKKYSKDIDPEILKEVVDGYRSEESFQLYYSQSSADCISMIEGGISTFVQTVNPPISTRAIAGHYCYMHVNYVKQKNSWCCGAAAIVQTLLSTGAISSDGSEAQNNAIQDVFINSMGISSSNSPAPYKIVNELNCYHPNSYTPVYIPSSMSNNQFKNLLANSLEDGYPPILNAQTGTLKYYRGKNIGHYISVAACNNNSDDSVMLVDPHYDRKYGGTQYETISTVKGTVNRRFLICKQR